MKSANYTTSFLVDQTPEEAFAAINNVRGWWSGNIEGSTNSIGDEWTYRCKDVHYSKQKMTVCWERGLIQTQALDVLV